MSGYLRKDPRFIFGILPVQMLELTGWSPMARLLWGVLDSYGNTAFPGLASIAFRMGLEPSNHKSVIRYTRELVEGDGLKVEKIAGGTNVYMPTLPDYCFIEDRQTLKFSIDQAGKAIPEGPPPSRFRKKPRLSPSDRLSIIEKRRAAKEKLVQIRGTTPGHVSQGTPGHVSHTPPDTRPIPPGTRVPGKGLREGEAKGGEELSASLSLRSDDQNQDTLQQILSSRAGDPDKARLPGQGSSARFRGAPWIERGFSAWPEIFERETGRIWVWTGANIESAGDLFKALPLALIEPTLTNYARNRYWSERGCPLKKLMENLTEFTPTRRSVAAPVSKPVHQVEQEDEQTIDESLAQAMRRYEQSRKAREAGASQAEIERILFGSTTPE